MSYILTSSNTAKIPFIPVVEQINQDTSAIVVMDVEQKNNRILYGSFIHEMYGIVDEPLLGKIE
jgi:hypothetical protein